MKIVSLLPSATEIVYALGRGHDLVGVTFECDFPLLARADAAVVVGGLETADLTPLEIDRLVRAEIAAERDLYHLDVERLRAAQPDVILTQDLCRVCALPSDRVAEALDFIACEASVVTLDPRTLSDVLDSIGAVGAALDAGRAAATLVSSLRERLATVAAALDAQTCATPSVFVLEWADPPFVSGHWVPELVIAAGGDPVLCEPGARSHPTDWGAVANAGADIVIVAPCGYDTAGAALQARQVLHRLPVDSQVWAVDANAYIVRPGPRLIDGVELLAAIFHPDCFGVPPADRAIRIR